MVAAVALISIATHGQDAWVTISDPSVKTVKVSLESNPYFPPILIMGSDDRLNVNFDYLDYDVHYLRYSLQHCNADWRPSQLMESEYATGFNYADITDYEQSYGTFAHYYNYNLSLPNDDIAFTKSGNYVLRVYPQDDPDKTLFTARFAVSENTVRVYAGVTSRTDLDYNNESQQVSVDIENRNNVILDPYGELTIVVNQNMRTDNEAVVTRPTMVLGKKITYDHNQSLIFKAGNEYRRIETVSINTINMGVDRIEYFEPYYHATLLIDERRDNTQYLYDKTQNGRFTIRNSECDDSFVCADYVVTHFSLDTGGRMLNGGKIYLQGEFTEGLSPSTRMMKWDGATGMYLCDLLLKQGAYNYQYLWVPDGTTTGITGKIEGDKYQTVNEYLVRIYDHHIGARYDRLIGYAIINSGL